MRILFFLIILIPSYTANSALNIEALTIQFYADLNAGDSIAVKTYFHDNCRVKHLGDKEVWDLSLDEFFEVLPKFVSNHFTEKIDYLEVDSVTGGFTYVNVYFDFYTDGNYSHSGMDHFCWTKRKGKLKIESIYSTDFKTEKSKVENKVILDEFMLKWHHDAFLADFDAYFEFMASDFIYLGTDPKERWTKEDFETYCKPYFENKSTWNFKTNSRNWYFSNDNNIAWFEESLSTEMEECRGSGVLIKTENGWKIAHYNLAVVIENEKMKKFIKWRRK